MASCERPRCCERHSVFGRERRDEYWLHLYSLKPLAERKVSASQIIDRLRPQLNRLPAASAFLQAAQDLRIGGRGGNAMYQYTLQADNVQDLTKWGPLLLNQMQHLPGFEDVSSDQQNGGLDEMMNYDRVTAAKLGLIGQSLGFALYYGAFGQSEVSIIHTQLNQYYVVLEVAPQFWQSPEGLKYIYLHTASGSVPLSAVAGYQANTTPLAVNHTGLFPSVTTSFNLANGVSLSDATREINQVQQKLGTPILDSRFFCGHAARVSAVAQHGTFAGSGRAAGRVYRARDFVQRAWFIL